MYDNARLSTNSRSCSNTARRTTSRSTSCDRAFRPKVKYLRGIAPKHLPGSHDRRSPSVLDVAKGHTHDNSAQPEMLSVTTAKGALYSAQCFHKTVAEVTIPPESDVTDYYDVSYLNPVSAGQTTMWNCTVQLNDHEVPFKVDTRAEVSIISEDQWKSWE